MNTKRYPDFKGLVAGLHKAGIKVVPNIKPCEYIPYVSPYGQRAHTKPRDPSWTNVVAAENMEEVEEIEVGA